MAQEQNADVERALWAAVRSLEEAAGFATRLASTAQGDMRRRFMERAETQLHEAEMLKRMILGIDDVPGVPPQMKLS